MKFYKKERIFKKSKTPQVGKCHILENGKVCERATKKLKGGMCRAHYETFRRAGTLDKFRIMCHSPYERAKIKLIKPLKGMCKIKQNGFVCDRDVQTRLGICKVHYEKFRRHRLRTVDGVKVR